MTSERPEEINKKVTAADGHSYYKSASANATVAPTNQTTITNASKTGKLNAVQAELVTIIDYEWSLGKDITFESIADEYGYEIPELRRLLDTDLVRNALTERGIKSVSRSLLSSGIS